MKKPNLFLVGAAKAGTTSVYNYLQSHPQVFVCPIKEPNYFGSDIVWENFRKDYRDKTYLDVDKYISNVPLRYLHSAFIDSLSHYEKLFKYGCGQKYYFEASTSYLYSNKAAGEIYEYNNKARIIIILRDPVERAISHYKMDVANRTNNESNIYKGIKKDYLKKDKGYGISNLYIEMSLYFNQVKRFIDIFGSDSLLVIMFEDMVNDEIKFMNRVCEFLNLYPSLIDIDNKKYNKTKILRYPSLKKVKRFYSLLPDKIKEKAKSYCSFLFSDYVKIYEEEKACEFIHEIVSEDFKKTKELLLYNNFII